MLDLAVLGKTFLHLCKETIEIELHTYSPPSVSKTKLKANLQLFRELIQLFLFQSLKRINKTEKAFSPIGCAMNDKS